jgi:hypothetical protein
VHRSTLAPLLAAALLAVTAGTALADPPSPANPAGPELGVVPVHSQAGKHGGGGSNLSYHGGPVLHTNATFAIYWGPSGSFPDATYQPVVDGFLDNVAAASVAQSSSNVYWSDTQYYDGSGSVAFSSQHVASYLDTHALPSSGCNDQYTSVCLSDQQIQQEISTVASQQHWTLGANTLVFMFTGKGVGSCYSSGSCAFSSYCAYHSNLSGGVPYANMPYAATVPAACGSGQSPNGGDADSTINVASHEHNEAITDPLGTAWFDQRGYEDGDKCAWTFGTALGGSSGAQYNQTINGGRYYLQREWSNRSSGCVLTGL